ncbi:unnamed protein product [Didymodactylos carnosus]|uniref:Uncharacterized protein n=1 Tax=Didymodactylos carnosus TaxID=1234261 RepID=A0A814JCP7_9BILA|nr:unnamed protein product [Didymodactylos carnosus]CAF3807034.1 unnamed protein product [Didymodactylos carnosus]
MENKQNRSTPKIDNERYLKLIVKQKTKALKTCKRKLIEYEHTIESQQKMIDHLLINIVQMKTENEIEQQLFRFNKIYVFSDLHGIASQTLPIQTFMQAYEDYVSFGVNPVPETYSCSGACATKENLLKPSKVPYVTKSYLGKKKQCSNR